MSATNKISQLLFLSEYIYFAFIFKRVFADSWLTVFSLITLNMTSHCLLASTVCISGISWSFLICDKSFVTVSKMISLYLTFKYFTIMFLNVVYLCLFSLWSFLDVQIFFIKFGKFLALSSLNIFSASSSSFLPVLSLHVY